MNRLYLEASLLLFFISLAIGLPQILHAQTIHIGTLQQLQDMNLDFDAEYILDNDIDAGETATWNLGAGFVPVGFGTSPFTGTFEGNGHVISGLTINRPLLNRVGLFGHTDGAAIQNLGIEAADVTGRGDVGALAGSSAFGTINKCYATGTVLGSSINVGGLVGVLIDGQVDNAYSQTAVTAASNGGGLVGRNLSGTVLNCYSSGRVSGVGILGGLSGSSSADSATVNSYWDLLESGQLSSSGGEGKTTVEMKQEATYVDWDFDSVWYIFEGQDYPRLRPFGPDFFYVEPFATCGGKAPCYSSIQTAVDDAGPEAFIKISSSTFVENLELNASKKLNLSGGWDDRFTALLGFTTIDGDGLPAVTVEDGLLVLENTILQ